jgi:hypothetical protein
VSQPVFEWHVIASGRRGPGPRSRHGLVHDPGRRVTILFGGIIWKGDGLLLDDTWELRSEFWTPVEAHPRPQARHRSGMVFDSHRGCAILFGGQGRTYGFLSDTWTYEDGRWARRRRWWSSGPPPRCGHAMAFDESTGETVLFGGVDTRRKAMRDTWVWNGDRWQEVRGPRPPARRYAAFAFDPGLHGCVLHGGAVDDQGRDRFGDAWLFRDGRWSRCPAEFDTDPRDDHGLAYHRAAKRLLLLEDLNGAGCLMGGPSDGWVRATVTPDPPRLQCSPVAWDAQLGGLIMHGGETGQGGFQSDITSVFRLVDR